MNQYNEISTLQYMGSKTRIISHICEPIIKNKSIKTVVDLFAGTGSVGYALKAHKNIISNDLEYYAYITNHAILNGCVFSVTDEISFWNAVEQQKIICKWYLRNRKSMQKCSTTLRLLKRAMSLQTIGRTIFWN